MRQEGFATRTDDDNSEVDQSKGDVHQRKCVVHHCPHHACAKMHQLTAGGLNLLLFEGEFKDCNCEFTGRTHTRKRYVSYSTDADKMKCRGICMAWNQKNPNEEKIFILGHLQNRGQLRSPSWESKLCYCIDGFPLLCHLLLSSVSFVLTISFSFLLFRTNQLFLSIASCVASAAHTNTLQSVPTPVSTSYYFELRMWLPTNELFVTVSYTRVRSVDVGWLLMIVWILVVDGTLARRAWEGLINLRISQYKQYDEFSMRIECSFSSCGVLHQLTINFENMYDFCFVLLCTLYGRRVVLNHTCDIPHHNTEQADARARKPIILILSPLTLAYLHHIIPI